LQALLLLLTLKKLIMKKLTTHLVTIAIILFFFTGCHKKDSITYPDTGKYGVNILSDQITSVSTDKEYSMTAVLPKGASVTVILKNGEWFYTPSANWEVTEYNDDTQTQEFTVLGDGKTADIQIYFDSKSENGSFITVEYYENKAHSPTKIKKLNLSTE
jgi:hypothetical protein